MQSSVLAVGYLHAAQSADAEQRPHACDSPTAWAIQRVRVDLQDMLGIYESTSVLSHTVLGKCDLTQ